jgi:hypothetical protein
MKVITPDDRGNLHIGEDFSMLNKLVVKKAVALPCRISVSEVAGDERPVRSACPVHAIFN